MFFFSLQKTTWWNWGRVTVSQGGKFDVVLPCHLHLKGLKSLSGSLQWPALQLQLDQVAPCCWSQLGLLLSISCTLCLSAWECVLSNPWFAPSEAALCNTRSLCTFMSFKLKCCSCDQSLIFNKTKQRKNRTKKKKQPNNKQTCCTRMQRVKVVSKTHSKQNQRTFFSPGLKV